MGIASSLYSSISGLNTMGNSMGVLGDNVANVNTIAFKSSRATFQDVLSQSVSTAAGSAQVGRGVTLSTVDGLFAQGSFESTSTATDLAIGGQGFFMLRSADNSAADMYSRAGEFRFDQEGFLVNPVGAFVQGWSIDDVTGEAEGTIGDINLGKSTPPVSSEAVEVIVNVDSREPNETNELRLYDAWDGSKSFGQNPEEPIESTNYEYTTALKVYDSKGASHDLTIYFDRTTNDNEWEYLVTCEPSEDLRYLSAKEQIIYAPNDSYNYEEHQGSGALQYGIINFTTAGDINKVAAWDVPPDGKVDVALDDNRLFLDPTDTYYSFEANFTGATFNQEIELSLGAKYNGLPTNQTQILVSEDGAFSEPGLNDYITKETLWADVYDVGGKVMLDGDILSYGGYDHDGNAVSGSYSVDTSDKLSVFLADLGSTFNGTASLDAFGRLRLQDNGGGDSGMYLTSFSTFSANNSEPFGGTTPLPNTWATTPEGAVDIGLTGLPADAGTILTNIGDAQGQIEVGDTFTFNGTDVAGVLFGGPLTYVVAGGDTVQTLMDFVSDIYTDGAVGPGPDPAVSVSVDASGRLRVYDNTGTNSGNFGDVACTFTEVGVVTGVTPWVATVGGNVLVSRSFASTQIDIASSKTSVTSPGRAFTTSSGAPPVISADTTWGGVYDVAGDQCSLFDGTETITVAGLKGNGVSVSYMYNINDPTDSVQDFLDGLENVFDADALIDESGRLTLRDWDANGDNYISSLQVDTVSYGGVGTPLFFGSLAAGENFETIVGQAVEDGSRMGDVVSGNFEPEALASTQYANSSTTVFQDQDGYAAGFLQSVSVDTDGVITGHYSNGQVLEKAQVALASFNNLAGLRKEGGNIFRETTDSGAPITGAPGSNGLGSIAPNALEQSNVDLGNEFVKLITTQRGFQANSKIITTTDEMLADLINIKR